jgi:hypothetical protein
MRLYPPIPAVKNALLTNFNPAAGTIIGNGEGAWQVQNWQVENVPG